jgi:hypothetical protein
MDAAAAAAPDQADEAADSASAEYDFSPDPAASSSASLLPLTVKSQLFQAFNDAVVSEQVMRMVAMKAATDNADQMGKRPEAHVQPRPPGPDHHRTDRNRQRRSGARVIALNAESRIAE